MILEQIAVTLTVAGDLDALGVPRAIGSCKQYSHS